MTDIKLPPLPEKVVISTHLPTGVRIYGYTADQMQAYASEAVRLNAWEPRAITHAADCWSWGAAHYECAMREIERLRKMHQGAYQRGLQAGSRGLPRGLREMYGAIQEVKRQDDARLARAALAQGDEQ